MDIERDANRNCSIDNEHKKNAMGHIPSKDDTKSRLESRVDGIVIECGTILPPIVKTDAGALAQNKVGCALDCWMQL
jgi:hypothetical protein